MNNTLLIGGLANILVSVICIALSVPLLRGMIKRNPWYGVRIRKAYVSEHRWREINRYGAKALIGWCIPVLLIGLGMLGASLMIPETQEEDLMWIIPLSLASLLTLGGLIQTLIWSKDLPDSEGTRA
ncbi:MAG: SdpI family protein [Verrucomicrobiales bacterium]